jgi:hypothetical protein
MVTGGCWLAKKLYGQLTPAQQVTTSGYIDVICVVNASHYSSPRAVLRTFLKQALRDIFAGLFRFR